MRILYTRYNYILIELRRAEELIGSTSRIPGPRDSLNGRRRVKVVEATSKDKGSFISLTTGAPAVVVEMVIVGGRDITTG
jgi:hypothetical protein